MSTLSRAFRVFVGVIGALVVLYALALVTLGMEDIGGPRVAIPVAVALIALGVWAIAFGFKRTRDEAA